jgi:hypothetical protein
MGIDPDQDLHHARTHLRFRSDRYHRVACVKDMPTLGSVISYLF